jgi:hypothetical protein
MGSVRKAPHTQRGAGFIGLTAMATAARRRKSTRVQVFTVHFIVVIFIIISRRRRCMLGDATFAYKKEGAYETIRRRDQTKLMPIKLLMPIKFPGRRSATPSP